MTKIIYDIILGAIPNLQSHQNIHDVKEQDSSCSLAEQYLRHRKQLLLNQNNSCSVKTTADQAKTIAPQLKQ